MSKSLLLQPGHMGRAVFGLIFSNRGLPRWLSPKDPACQCRSHGRRGFDPWVRKIPWRRTWQPNPVFLLGESHGQRSVVGGGPSVCQESDMSIWAGTHNNREGTSDKGKSKGPEAGVNVAGSRSSEARAALTAELIHGGRQESESNSEETINP